MDNKKTTTVERILQFIDFKGISKREFSNKVGISHSLIGKSHSIGSDKIEKILQSYPEINPVWLLTGKSDMIINTDVNLSQERSRIIEDNILFLEEYYPYKLTPYCYEYTQIRYYEHFNISTLDDYLSAEMSAFEDLYNMYSDLIKFFHFLGIPNFLAKKYPIIAAFSDEIKRYIDEFENETIGLSDDKLKKILFILYIKSNSDHYIYVTSVLVHYIDTYKDMIKEKVIVDYDPNYSL